MKTFLRIVGVLFAMALLAVLVAFFLPRKVAVARSIEIAAPPERVYPLVADLAKWELWIPWNKELDPTVKVVYSDRTAGPGAWYTWDGEQLRTGKVEIDAVEADRLVDFGVTFDGQGPNDGTLTFEPTESGTKATWSADFDMGMNPVGRYFGLALDSMIGPEFEKGLTKLKTVAESEATRPSEPPAGAEEPTAPAPRESESTDPSVETPAPAESPETEPSSSESAPPSTPEENG